MTESEGTRQLTHLIRRLVLPQGWHSLEAGKVMHAAGTCLRMDLKGQKSQTAAQSPKHRKAVDVDSLPRFEEMD